MIIKRKWLQLRLIWCVWFGCKGNHNLSTLCGRCGVELTRHLPGNLACRLAYCILDFFFQSREVWKPEGLYLKRWFVTPLRWLRKWPMLLWWVPLKWRRPVFLHNIRLSDARVPHDHPGSFTTFIALGSYVERYWSVYTTCHNSRWQHLPAHLHGMQERVAKPGSVLKNPINHVHYVEIVKPVWSVVLGWQASRVWGFWKDSETWVDWRTYLDLKDEPDSPEDAIAAT